MPSLPDYNPNDFEQNMALEDVQTERFRSERNAFKEPYTIVMPPPNVTGMLHMGHILNNTIQDVLIRYKRMDGFEACWIPGLDHASIATETKVTRWLAGQNIDKKTIGRERFLEYAMQWKNEYGGIINDQLKRLGISCDWSRERFTMDEQYSRDVLQSFVDLYNDGLIYKGKRMVNWCPVSKSAISDEEVEHIEERGYLWHFAYPIKDSNETITIATTRPETMFGDVAVMVHPKDKRYKHLIGKKAVLPFVGRELPIIGDNYVDPEFGTGAVKVTPAHDPNDYEVGLRHGLEMPVIMTEEAKMSSDVPESYRGLDRFEARQAVVAGMKHLGLLKKIEEHTHKVGYSQRGHVPIEPMLSEQWFIAMKTLAAQAKAAVENGSIEFYPAHWKKTYFYWLDNIKDWCISRQLWWGHRIPVFTCANGHQYADTTVMISCPKCGAAMSQDESVLDTWASSWLWSYAVHLNEEDKNYYHPTNTLVTGPDIIFFWVARMIMAAGHFRQEIPFKNVYFTGIIRDDAGRKMSKSLGNSPDPLDVMKEYGADALRYTMIRLAPLGNDILYSSEKVELGKHFANKIWNAARFALINKPEESQTDRDLNIIIEAIENNSLYGILFGTTAPHFLLHKDNFDKSTLFRLNETIHKVRDHFDKFRFNEAAKDIYEFVWNDFCDRYIESSKFSFNRDDPSIRESKWIIMMVVFSQILKLLHPIMPFLTEKLYREVFGKQNLAFRQYPVYDPLLEEFSGENARMKRLEQALYMIRELRAESSVPPGTRLSCVIAADDALAPFFTENVSVFCQLAKLSSLEIVSLNRTAQPGEAVRSEFDFQVFLDLGGVIDKDKEKERLAKEVARLEKAARSVEGKLANRQFLAKAPASVVEKEKEKLAEILSELEKTRSAHTMWD